MPDLPCWWSYPTHCHRGHEWGPGKVIVGSMPCDCPGARTNDNRHLWVRCNAEQGCPSIWYRPPHHSTRRNAADGPAEE